MSENSPNPAKPADVTADVSLARPSTASETSTLVSAAAGASAALREGPGTAIGPYTLLQLIGEGGFGSIFMAQQEHPVRRKVALKIIKLGMDTRQVVARFEQERQALAVLDHPHIAKVFDAGATETGRPYFVMELVKGEPLSEYADKHNLSIEQRLDLFGQVCAAVQHAHTKGIIHRDLKPGNVLVSSQDGTPIAKVIDFGIAKATQARMTERTLFTEHRQIIGTPEYMSPEQAEGSLDIDTRADVYALGVMLYELLTGSTPLGGGELRSAAYAEMQRIIREVEPPKPSTRLSQNAATMAHVAARRKTEPRRLGSLVRGELDWIVMKALEKDRARRYETASGLAADIQRYLAGEAVVAAPPSTAYRFKKFFRRNRAMVSAVSAVAAVLLIGAVAFALQAGVAGEQRDRAVSSQRAEAEQRTQAEAARAKALEQKARAQTNEAAARTQEAEARNQAAIAEAVAAFQTDMLAAVDPANLPKDPATGEPLKDRVTVVQAIEAAVKRLDDKAGDEGSLNEQPLVEASVRSTIGLTLQGLGRYADAEPNLRKSLALRRAALPAGHLDIAASMNNLAGLLYDQNQSAEAEALYRESLALNRAAFPAGHPATSRSLNDLAMLLYRQNKLAEADPLLRESLAIDRATLPAGHPSIASGLDNLAKIRLAEDKPAEAEPLFREALAIRRAAYPAEHPVIALGLNNLANTLRAQNKLAEAEPLQREALAVCRAALPAGHPDIAISVNSLAFLLTAQNKLAEAEPLYREALAINRAALPAGHPEIATNLNNLAMFLLGQNNASEAELLQREALDIWRTAFPSGHPAFLNGLGNLARVQHALGKTADARAGWDHAIASLRKTSPNGSTLLTRLLWRSGTARFDNKDYVAARTELQEALAMGERLLPADHPQIKECRETLARCEAAMAK